MNSRPIQRRCIACRQLFDRRQLFKVIRDYKDGVVLDVGTGRSAYLCKKKDCLDNAHRHKRLQKALRCQVSENVMTMLQKKLNRHIHSGPEAI